MSEKYAVCRYFDDYYEGIVDTYDTEEEAENCAQKLNAKPRAYVSYEVKKVEAPHD